MIFERLGALCTELSKAATRLAASGASHANAEAANSPGASSAPAVPSHPVPAPTSVTFAHPASAYGGTNIFPEGWTFIQALVSATWPDGDTGKMRHGKSAWNALADDIDDASSKYISTLLQPLEGFVAPDIAAIAAKTSWFEPEAKALSDGCRRVAASCGEYADYVDEAHEESNRELREFLITSIAAIGISALLTPFTAGISDLVGGAAVAADAAITAGRVSLTLGRLAARVAPLLVRLGEASRAGSGAESLAGKAAIFAGKSAATTSLWSASSVVGDYLVNGSAANPQRDIEYSVAAGVLGETGKAAGEALSAGARSAMTGSARAATRVLIDDIPDASRGPAETAALSGPKHSAGPTPLKVTVTAAGIKALADATGLGSGALVGQAVTTGVEPEKLPADMLKDGIQGLIPVLKPPGLHAVRIP